MLPLSNGTHKCMHVCTHTHTYIHMHTQTHTHTEAHIRRGRENMLKCSVSYTLFYWKEQEFLGDIDDSRPGEKCTK